MAHSDPPEEKHETTDFLSVRNMLLPLLVPHEKNA
jgi:hypothetical protein